MIKKEIMNKSSLGPLMAQHTLSFNSILISKQPMALLRMATDDLRDCPSALTTYVVQYCPM